MWKRHVVHDRAYVAALLGTLDYSDWINGLISMYMMKND